MSLYVIDDIHHPEMLTQVPRKQVIRRMVGELGSDGELSVYKDPTSLLHLHLHLHQIVQSI